jgi:hypothetical protein
MKYILAAACLPTASCGDFIDSCFNCPAFNRDKPVPVGIAPLQIIAGARPLPVEARNIYYDEQCGIGCLQVFRFELSADRANRIMTELTGSPPHDLSREDVADFMSGSPINRAWRKSAGPARAKGGLMQADNGWPLNYVIISEGDGAIVFLASNSM